MGSPKTLYGEGHDRLEWNYIRKCFEQMGFHPIWDNWIMECITSVSYSIMINDELNGLVRPTRAVRQGDLCPHIYSILCMKMLSNSLLIESK